MLARIAEMFWYPPGTVVDGDAEADVSGIDGASSGVGVTPDWFDEDEGGDPSDRTAGVDTAGEPEAPLEAPLAFCCWMRRARMRSRRYSKTWVRISIPETQKRRLVSIFQFRFLS